MKHKSKEIFEKYRNKKKLLSFWWTRLEITENTLRNLPKYKICQHWVKYGHTDWLESH